MNDKERAKFFVKTIKDDPEAIIKWCNKEIKAWKAIEKQTEGMLNLWCKYQIEAYEELADIIQRR